MLFRSRSCHITFMGGYSPPAGGCLLHFRISNRNTIRIAIISTISSACVTYTCRRSTYSSLAFVCRCRRFASTSVSPPALERCGVSHMAHSGLCRSRGKETRRIAGWAQAGQSENESSHQLALVPSSYSSKNLLLHLLYEYT